MKKELDAVVTKFMSSAPEDVQQKLLGLIDQLLENGIADKAIKVGDTAPSFSLPNVFGQQVSFYEQIRKGPTVLSFYRGGWCPFCNLELIAYQKILPELQENGAILIAVSPEKVDSSISTVEKNGLGFEVLSDAGNIIAAKFGLVFALEPAMQNLYAELGAKLPKINGDESWTLPIPATYVVNGNGKVVWAHVNANYLERAEPQDVLNILKQMRTGNPVKSINL